MSYGKYHRDTSQSHLAVRDKKEAEDLISCFKCTCTIALTSFCITPVPSPKAHLRIPVRIKSFYLNSNSMFPGNPYFTQEFLDEL